jgi:predicted RNA-binding protein (virulence factor B family)
VLKIGEQNKLEVLRSTSVGMFLGGEGIEDVLLPLKYIPDTLEVGDEIEVFIYTDSEDRVIATTLTPKIKLDSYAALKVVAVASMGVFFDIGLEKDLFVPAREQNAPVKVGDKRIVYMFLDPESARLVGSMKWREFCFKEDPVFEVNQKVNIVIGEQTDLGRNVLIENAFYGLIFANEIFEELEIGDERDAYIKTLREDGDIDVTLQELGYGHVLSSSDKILELLKASNGILEIGDKSSPEKVIAITGMSKKVFKKAIGDLYKKKLVLLEKEKVTLVVE